MKKYMRVLILALVLTALMCLPAFAGYDSATPVNASTTIEGFSQGVEKLTSITQTGVQANEQYLLLVLDDSYGVDYPTDDNILFVDQAKATAGGVVTFNNDELGIYPSVAKNSTVYLAGPGMKNAEAEDGPQKIATLGVSGVTVSGQVKSYNPNNATTIQLMKGGVEQFKTTIAAASGSGQLEQSFSIDSVNPDTYDLVVTKAGHLTYTITGVVVGDGGLDLAGNANAAIKLITLLAGDVNGDGSILENDVAVIRLTTNIYKSTAEASDKTADLNGDGSILENDVAIVRLTQHIYKSATNDCTISYTN